MEHYLLKELSASASVPSSPSAPVLEDEDEDDAFPVDWTYCLRCLQSSSLPSSSLPSSSLPSSSLPSSAPRATGIDTLKLFFPVRPLRRPDFHVLQRQQVRRDVGEGVLWRDPQDNFAFGAMAVCRAGAMRFRIAPVGGDIKLRAFFSASAAAYGHNSRTITRDDLLAVLEEMQETLRERGVEVDWREGQVSRVDVHRDVPLQRPFGYYLPALQLIEPRYGRIWQNYPTGVLRGASTRLVYSLYDKRAQCHAKKTPLPPDTDGFPGWLRCEARLQTAVAVREGLEISSVGELLERFKELPAWLDKRIERDLLFEKVPEHLNYPKGDLPTLTPDDPMWWQAQLIGDSKGFKDRLAWVGLRHAYETIGPQKFWELAKREDRSDALQPSKLRAHFRETALNSFSDQILPVAMLYQELKSALLTRRALRW